MTTADFMTADQIKERAEYLRSIVRGRPIAILLPGSSIEELSDRIDEFRDYDICYFSLNVFHILEEYILKKIRKRLSVIFVSAGTEIERMPNIIEFLDRDEDNLLGTVFTLARPRLGFLEDALKEEVDDFVNKYKRKLLFIDFTNDTHPNYLFQFPPSTNTLTGLLCLAVASKPTKIILFGADGGWQKESATKSYFRSDAYSEAYLKTKVDLSPDTAGFNRKTPYLLQDWYKFCNMEPIDIINCSINSKYDIFPKCTYDELLSRLNKVNQ